MKWLQVLVLALAVLPVLVAPADACSCVPRTPAQQAEAADVVFVGTLASVERPLFIRSSIDPVTYRFTVGDVLKGQVGPATAVRSANSGASCGLEGLREGARYTVFARADGAGLTTGLCSGTAERAYSASELGLAGGNMAGVPHGDPGPLSPANGNALFAAAVLAAGVLALGALTLLRRARQPV